MLRSEFKIISVTNFHYLLYLEFRPLPLPPTHTMNNLLGTPLCLTIAKTNKVKQISYLPTQFV